LKAASIALWVRGRFPSSGEKFFGFLSVSTIHSLATFKEFPLFSADTKRRDVEGTKVRGEQNIRKMRSQKCTLSALSYGKPCTLPLLQYTIIISYFLLEYNEFDKK
jgi:hypothetical protein